MTGVLVCGPQCTGSKAVARMLIAAGGGRHHSGHYIGGPVADQNKPLVLHCSFPQGRDWHTVDRLRSMGEWDRAVVCVRSFWPHLHSMVGTREYGGQVRPWGTTGHHPDLETAEQVMRRAYAEVFGQLYHAGVEYRVVTHRELADEPRARARLAQWCGLDPDAAESFEFNEENSKWYDG